jgi:hypothetical protein
MTFLERSFDSSFHLNEGTVNLRTGTLDAKEPGRLTLVAREPMRSIDYGQSYFSIVQSTSTYRKQSELRQTILNRLQDVGNQR